MLPRYCFRELPELEEWIARAEKWFPDSIYTKLDVNFIAFDNYSTVYSLTEHLIESGYERLSLFTGGSGQFNEKECISAFEDAHEALEHPYQPSCIHSCNMTKEDAFHVQMDALLTEVPQVIISSAETITIGITEALSLCHIRIPEDVVIITLGIESWHSSNYHPGTLRTSRRAYTLGREAASLLIQNILQPAFFETKYIMHQDRYTKESYKLPEPPPKYQIPVHKKTLRILAAELPTIHALKLVSRDFCTKAGINIQFDYLPISELFKGIYEDSHKEHGSYDIYMFDIAWLNYLAREQCLRDLTSFITSRQFDFSHIIEKNLKNCNYKGHYYGLPIIGGTHLLFYRKDIFEKNGIKPWTNTEEFYQNLKQLTRNHKPDTAPPLPDISLRKCFWRFLSGSGDTAAGSTIKTTA